MYQISSYGRVRSLDRYVDANNGKKQFYKGQLLTICHNKRVDFYEIHLRKNNKRNCLHIHILVV